MQDGRISRYCACVVGRSAKGRDAEGAKDAEVRWARVMACVVFGVIC